MSVHVFNVREERWRDCMYRSRRLLLGTSRWSWRCWTGGDSGEWPLWDVQICSEMVRGGTLEVDLGSAWNDSGKCGCSWNGPMWQRQLIIAKASKEELGCLDTCQHLAEDQFLTTTTVTPRSRGYGDVTAMYIRRSKIPSRIYAKHQYRQVSKYRSKWCIIHSNQRVPLQSYHRM